MNALQPEFARALRNAERAVPHGLAQAHTAETRRRFATHRNTFVVTLIDALCESYPVCVQLTGEAYFRELARQRIDDDPPRSPVLAEFITAFPDYLATQPAAQLPCMLDVARIEAARIVAFNAADDLPLATGALAALLDAPERLPQTRMRLHGAATWLRCAQAGGSAWLAHQQVDVDAALAAVDADRCEDVLVHRSAFAVEVRVLPPGGAACLDALRDGRSLGDAFAHALQADDEAEATNLFELLIHHQLIAALLN